MRLWSLHPRYLDGKGLVALWREGLLARAVLFGRTRGYRHHPQLIRFLNCLAPRRQISVYLRAVYEESLRRGYRFNPAKIEPADKGLPLQVTRGQLEYEWTHLRRKLEKRSPEWLDTLRIDDCPEPHPYFQVVEGGLAEWEVLPNRKPRPGNDYHTHAST